MDGFNAGFHPPISGVRKWHGSVYNSVSRVGMTGFRGALVAGWVSAGVGGEGGEGGGVQRKLHVQYVRSVFHFPFAFFSSMVVRVCTSCTGIYCPRLGSGSLNKQTMLSEKEKTKKRQQHDAVQWPRC
jgi:hypothetical protein